MQPVGAVDWLRTISYVGGSLSHTDVGSVEAFYREAGPADAPVLLLLHGFPTASHIFRDLIPMLADSYREIGDSVKCTVV